MPPLFPFPWTLDATAGIAVAGLGAAFAVAVATWLASLHWNDLSVVDRVWGPLIALPAWVYALSFPAQGPRATLMLLIVTLWAARLSWHITRRSWGHPEDRRYQAMRKRNGPSFRYTSLGWVFGLQAVIAWVVGQPFLAGMAGTAPWGWTDTVGLALALSGLAIETVADAQLTRFKADPANAGRVMDRGLWAWSRHPNYFGETLCVWGLGLMGAGAAAGGAAAWVLVAPLIMTALILKVSGVTLLEADLTRQRPGYADYVARVPAFIPRPPRR